MATSKKSSKAQPKSATFTTDVPKTVKKNAAKFQSPRTIKGGTKSTDNVSKSPWKTIDPVIPIIAVDWEPPKGDDDAQDKYGKGRKVNRKKNGNQF